MYKKGVFSCTVFQIGMMLLIRGFPGCFLGYFCTITDNIPGRKPGLIGLVYGRLKGGAVFGIRAKALKGTSPPPGPPGTVSLTVSKNSGGVLLLLRVQWNLSAIRARRWLRLPSGGGDPVNYVQKGGIFVHGFPNRHDASDPGLSGLFPWVFLNNNRQYPGAKAGSDRAAIGPIGRKGVFRTRSLCREGTRRGGIA